MIKYFKNGVLQVETLDLPQDSGEIKVVLNVEEDTEDANYYLEFACPKNVKYISQKLYRSDDGCYEVVLPRGISEYTGEVYVQLVIMSVVDARLITRSLIARDPLFVIKESILATKSFDSDDKRDFFEYVQGVTQKAEDKIEEMGNFMQEVPNMVLEACDNKHVEIDQEIGECKTKIEDNIAKIDTKFDKANVTGEVGESDIFVMSQKAVTEELDKKFDKSDIASEIGQSETQIMSQKVVTDELDKKLDKTGGVIAGDLKVDGVLYTNNVDVSGSYRSNSIELSGAVDTPFIDWHFKNSEDDYNIRMIMNAKDRIDITGGAVNFEKIMINNNDLFSIGSILMFADETEPAKLYGGTWEKIVDRFLLGAGGKYGLGVTGGSENAVVVAHRHNEIQYVNNSAWSIGDTLGLGGTQTRPYSTKIGNVSQTTGAKSHYCTSWDGESGTDKNMPPYLAVNIWKRIA